MRDDPSSDFLARALVERLPELTSQVRRRLREEVPAFDADLDPALAMRMSERITVSLRALVDGLNGADEPDGGPIEEAVAEAQAAAQAGIDLNALLRTYRVAQSATWDVLMTETTRALPDPDAQLAVQKRMSQFQFAWNDGVVSDVIRAYEEEQRRFFFQSRERQLRAALREVLAGRGDWVPGTDYPSEGPHLGAVVWGNQVDKTIERVRSLARASATLRVEAASGAVLAWFALRSLDGPDSGVETLRRDLQPPAGAHVAMGATGTGLAGFRTSHQQAWRAYRVGRWSEIPVIWYSDVALESLFLRDMQAANDLVMQQLGPLDLTDPRTEVLNETMRAYFRCGCNATEAAAELGVHERTVAYRLRTVEERLDIDVSRHRDELAVALRLLDVLHTISSARSPIGPTARL